MFKNPQYMFDANIDEQTVLNLGNQLGISRFVYTSSAVTLGENLGIGNENWLTEVIISKYEESKISAEKEAFNFKKNFEFVSSTHLQFKDSRGSVQNINLTLSKTNPPLIRNNISIVDIDDCTNGGYNTELYDERYIK